MRRDQAMPLKEFSVPAALLLIALLTWLFLIGRLNGPSFLAGFGVVILAAVLGAVLLARYEDVSEFHAKGGGAELLIRMEKVRDDVYAKVDSLRRLAEYLGRLAAFNVTTVGRLPSGDLDSIMLRERDELAVMLREAGVAPDQISAITGRITRTIIRDLASAVIVQEAIPKIPQETRVEIVGLLIDSPLGEAAARARPVFQRFGMWTDSVQAKVSEFEEFRRTDKLPQVSRPSGFGAR
jgi:hypothetical protein